MNVTRGFGTMIETNESTPGDAVNIIRGSDRPLELARSAALSNSKSSPDQSLSQFQRCLTNPEVPFPSPLTGDDERIFIDLVFRAIVAKSDEGQFPIWFFRGCNHFLYGHGCARFEYLYETKDEWDPRQDPRYDEWWNFDREFDFAIERNIAEQRIEITRDVNGYPVFQVVNWREAIAEICEDDPDGFHAKSRDKIAALRAMPYKDYLQSEHWQYRRFVHLAFAENRCQVCNSDRRLNVHHRSYERRGYERASDLIVLCGACHKLFHENGRVK